MPRVSTLYAEITARTDGLDRALRSSTTKMQQFGSKMAGIGKAISSRVFSPAGITAIGVSLAIATKKAVDFADTIDKTAIRTGLARDTLQEFSFVGDQLGVNFGALEQAIRGFGIQIPLIRGGTSEAAKEWKKLNVELEDGRGNLRSMDKLFPDIIKALADMDNETEQLALAQKIFGSRGGVALIPLLKAGSEQIEELTKRFHELGLGVDNDGITKLVALKDKFAEAGTQIEATFMKALVQIAPVITDSIIPAIERLVSAIGKFGSDPKLLQSIKTLALISEGKYGEAISNEFNDPFRNMKSPRQIREDAFRQKFAPGGAGWKGWGANLISSGGGEESGGGSGLSLSRIGGAGFNANDPFAKLLARGNYDSRLNEVMSNLISTYDHATKAADGVDLGLRKIQPPLLKFSDDIFEASHRLSSFQVAMGSIALDAIHNFGFALGDAISQVVLFGDSLGDTLKNLARQAGGSVVGGLLNFGIAAGLSAIPFGSLFGKGAAAVVGAVRGDQFGNIAGKAAAPRPSFSVGLSLGRMTVEQSRASTRAGLHMIGLR